MWPEYETEKRKKVCPTKCKNSEAIAIIDISYVMKHGLAREELAMKIPSFISQTR